MHSDNRAQTLSLRDIYEQFHKPDLEANDASPRTCEYYRVILNAWERLTDDPPLAAIDNSTVAAFRDALLAEDKARVTVNKAWRAIRCLLRRAGPPQYRNPAGLNLISTIPYMRELREDLPLPKIASFDELSAIYDACTVADWPSCEIPAARWWQCLLVLAYNAGARRSDLLNLRTSDVSFTGRRLQFKARKTRKFQSIPINETVIRHLEMTWSRRPLVFPRATHEHRFRDEWKRIQSRAGLHRPVTFPMLRATCSSNYCEVGGELVAAFILGHTVRTVPSVTVKHYLNPSGPIRTACDELPQPAAFVAGLDQAVETPQPMTRSDWEFRPGCAVFRGQEIKLPPRLLRCLQLLVSAGRPLGFDDLAAVFYDRPDVSPVTIKTTVHQLRRRLVRALKLPPALDPLPMTYERDAWLLSIPSTTR